MQGLPKPRERTGPQRSIHRERRGGARHADLRPGGLIAIVDFHDSPFAWFRRWMGVNHVRLDGHLLPRLRQRFEASHLETPRAYGGFWRYAIFVGRRR